MTGELEIRKCITEKIFFQTVRLSTDKMMTVIWYLGAFVQTLTDCQTKQRLISSTTRFRNSRKHMTFHLFGNIFICRCCFPHLIIFRTIFNFHSIAMHANDSHSTKSWLTLLFVISRHSIFTLVNPDAYYTGQITTITSLSITTKLVCLSYSPS